VPSPTALPQPFFGSVPDVLARLEEVGYLADQAIATTVFLADRLGKPLLVEGPAGVGKTELAKAVGAAAGADLVRLQCYEGLDEARALYEWNYSKQLLRIQAARATTSDAVGAAGGATWDAIHDDIFSEEFLLPRPLLTAIRRSEPTVLLVDETDKADVEVEGLLLEVLSDFQVTVPELGTITASRRPFVVLTSNATRELSEALKRRCLFLHLDYPDADREKAIVLSRVPEVGEQLATQLVRVVRALRTLELRKSPSVAESIDWARTLVALGLTTLDEEAVRTTLGVVLKHHGDQKRSLQQLKLADLS
jgi:MoxR-like ATPase